MTIRLTYRLLLAAALFFGGTASAVADTFTVGVQPILPAKATQAAYTPLMKYLEQKTGHKYQLVTAPNFLSYWQEMKKGKYQITLDAAHLADYRSQKMGYKVIAKVLDVVSFTLVTGEDVFAFEPSELVGKRIASLASPSRGALTLDTFFTNPIRQPILIEVTNAQDAVQKVLDKKADGAIIPTPLVGGFPQLNVVATQEQWPHMAISTSGDISTDVTASIQTALIDAANNPEGQKMLETINFPGFEKADADIYKGYSDILKGFWGF